MQANKTDILANLVSVYKKLYTHKDLLTVDLKYSINEVEDFYGQMKDSFNISTTKKKHEAGKISDTVLALKTPDDVKDYLSNNNQSKDDLLKNLSLDEFSYLYKIIYSSSLKSNMRKIDALNAIEKYFYGISRAISMRP
jgi:hypothetical protein